MLIHNESSYNYQIGGSLDATSPTYIERRADHELYTALNSGEFCYVLNSRQMGKSSLRIRIMHRLRQKGFRCVSIDLTNIGSKNITAQQWYRGIAFELCRNLELLNRLNFKPWWQDHEVLSPIQQLSCFIEDVLLQEIRDEKIFIFIDEIDSVLCLDFSVDDFFALIRYYGNRRAEQTQSRRLTFALFGVATPTDLIQDCNRTPFNIGRAIALEGFRTEEIQPLVQGLTSVVNNPQQVVAEILYWTAGQPFLTQKLCWLVVNHPSPTNQPIAQLVQQKIVQNWKIQDHPNHLKIIHDRLLSNQQRAGKYLGIYQKILQEGSISTDDSVEQVELLLSGLVVKRGDQLTVYNRIYQSVFNLQWVEQQLSNLRPYAAMLNQWIHADYQDSSRLLQGQALKDAQLWAQDKSLSDLDYRFLAASKESEQRVIQKILEAERIKEMEARLVEQARRFQQKQENIKLQKRLLGVVSTAFCVATGWGITAFWQYQQAIRGEVTAIATASNSLFELNQRLDALVQAIKARHRLNQLKLVDPAITAHVNTVLTQALYSADEYNRLPGDWGIAYSPDGQLIVTSYGAKIQLWKSDGTLIRTISGHRGDIRQLTFSPDGQRIASASEDNTVKTWSLDGKLIATFTGHQAEVWEVAFTPNRERIISASEDGTVKLWTLDGKVVQTLSGYRKAVFGFAFNPKTLTLAIADSGKTLQLWKLDSDDQIRPLQPLISQQGLINALSFSPDGKTLASASHTGGVKLWQRDRLGQFAVFPYRTIAAHSSLISTLTFSPDSQTFASGSWDKTIKLWNRKGVLLNVFNGHKARLARVLFSPDGKTLASSNSQILASSSGDRSLRFWHLQNPVSRTLHAHRKLAVLQAVFSQDGQKIASASEDTTIKLWQGDGKFFDTLNGHSAHVLSVAFSPDDQILASGSWDGTLGFWQFEVGTGKYSRFKQLAGHRSAVWKVAFSNDGQHFASASQDGTVKLWSRQGDLLQNMRGHSGEVRSVAFSPNGQLLASAGMDKTIRLWTIQGKLLQTLRGHHDSVLSIAWSPDGQQLVSGSDDHTIKLWNNKGSLQKTLLGHVAEVRGLVFSPDGQFLASASADKTIKLWKTDGTELITLKGHANPVWSVGFSPDGQHLLSTSEDGTVKLWRLDLALQPKQLLAQSCDWVNDYLLHNPDITQSDRRLCQSMHPR
jgi:WD40 repeat protein